MMTKTFSRDSWHFRLVKWFDIFFDPRELDFCAYIRTVTYWSGVASLMAGASIFFAACVAFIISDAILSCIFMYFYGFDMFSPSVIIMGVILLGFGVAVVAWKYNEAGYKFTKKIAEVCDKDGFVRESYASFKEKHCARVEFK